MAAEVHSITRDTDVGRLATTPAAIRHSCDCEAATDLADLLETVAAAVAARRDPPMSEDESWRWSATVGTARRISRRWAS